MGGASSRKVSGIGEGMSRSEVHKSTLMSVKFDQEELNGAHLEVKRATSRRGSTVAEIAATLEQC